MQQHCQLHTAWKGRHVSKEEWRQGMTDLRLPQQDVKHEETLL